jgi:hypothetical protein
MSFNNEVYRNYLLDLGTLFKEEALSAKQELDQHRDAADKDYYIGQLIAWHTVISVMQQQASSFNIPLAEIKLDGIEPERDLL